MHPAFSVIVFTMFSGAGYGLAAWLGVGLIDYSSIVAKAGYILALTLIVAGLLSSTLHLGNRRNAIHAFSQWRTSWLSREGVSSILAFIPLFTQAFLVLYFDTGYLWIGLLGAILSVITVFFTAMIYASLRTINLWHTWLTPAVYLSFSIASGGLLLSALMAMFIGISLDIAQLALLALLIAWLLKWRWNARQNLGFGGSSMETATGLGHLGKVRLLEPPHMMDNYLTHEMAYRVARKHAQKLWRFAVVLGLVVPVIAYAFAIALGAPTSAILFTLAFMAHMAGLMVERWLFFANAKHSASLYYGGDALKRFEPRRDVRNYSHRAKLLKKKQCRYDARHDIC